VFGASRLPALGESIGKTIRNVKRGMSENDEIQVTEAKKQIANQGAAKANGDVRDAELVDSSHDPKA
jgi:sec-independent protein translocase protein TatA